MIWKYYLWNLNYEEVDIMDTLNWYEVYSICTLEYEKALTLVVL